MKLPILPQPDDVTCGPTCLHAVYRHHGLDLDLEAVIGSVNVLHGGGTLAVYLGIDALRRGFRARLQTYNLRVFDPSWAGLPAEAMVDKLKAQLQYKGGKKFTEATFAYIEFLELGGRIAFDDLEPGLLKGWLERRVPVLTGLSATYLYDSTREYTNARNQAVFHDLKGEPTGHFVVLYGMEGEEVLLADPYKDNPIRRDHHYAVGMGRLINAILLGIMTYDANLLILEPGPSAEGQTP